MSSPTLIPSPFPSHAEQLASAAQSLNIFSRVNLVGVRNDLIPLLREFGRNSIFSEYTAHDITHIDSLLGMLDWLVIEATRDAMTPTDWMLAVLAIYFHDAGLIVTKKEFAERDRSRFPDFRASVLDNPSNSPYKEKVLALGSDEQEKFLYQEFVRNHHAERIRKWITGEFSDHLGISEDVRKEITRILSPLDQNFRDDLGMICESHHKDDVGSFQKYPTQQAYGSTIPETANLQFAAILLRTVDLLHVTRDRTPSVSFAIAAPSDPKSLEEWQKQIPVVSVRKSSPRDDNNVVNNAATPDTVAISGRFSNATGFFALSEYLVYAEQQLKLSHRWAEETAFRDKLGYIFPWKQLDLSQLQAVGFESKKFVFTLDKQKILKLLVGHTLYSNSNVVVRELIQNSLDATRLAHQADPAQGRIEVQYDSKGRFLSVSDNGTGMTQRIIEEHFLNVGSSRYRDDNFVKEHPKFSAISRFGIGILSTFMVADEIEVYTRSASEDLARNISIRNVNGQYLIRLLDPNHTDVPKLIQHHGTSIKLKIRAGSTTPDVLQTAKFWVAFPGCQVNVRIDGDNPVTVGYASPKDALEDVLRSSGVTLTSELEPKESSAFRVIERARNGVQLAFAVQWNPGFKNWGFMNPISLTGREQRQAEIDNIISVCVQGIRVESTAPGFNNRNIVAIANCTGKESPETNVARSMIEPGAQTDLMNRMFYGFYSEHIKEEISAMHRSRGLALSEAASEGRFLIRSLPIEDPSDRGRHQMYLLRKVSQSIPWLTIDLGAERKLVTVDELESRGSFWTVESVAVSSAETFLRRMPNAISLRKLFEFSEAVVNLPDEGLVSGYAESRRVLSQVSASFSVDSIDIQAADRQMTLRWRLCGSEGSLWESTLLPGTAKGERINQIASGMNRYSGIRSLPLLLQNSDEVSITGAGGYHACLSVSGIYVFKGSDLHTLLEERLRKLRAGEITETSYVFAITLANHLIDAEFESDASRQRLFESLKQQFHQHFNVDPQIDSDVRELAMTFNGRMFDPAKGDRYQMLLRNSFADF